MSNQMRLHKWLELSDELVKTNEYLLEILNEYGFDKIRRFQWDIWFIYTFITQEVTKN